MPVFFFKQNTAVEMRINDWNSDVCSSDLKSENVDIITGVTFSNVMMAIHKPITDAKVFFIGSNAGPAPIAGKNCSPYFFSTSWDNDMQIGRVSCMERVCKYV